MSSMANVNGPASVLAQKRMAMMSWPSVPTKSEKGMDTSFHSELTEKFFMAGMRPPLVVKIMTRYVRASPRAQKCNVFFSERFAGVNGAGPGENITPAQA